MERAATTNDVVYTAEVVKLCRPRGKSVRLGASPTVPSMFLQPDLQGKGVQRLRMCSMPMKPWSRRSGMLLENVPVPEAHLLMTYSPESSSPLPHDRVARRAAPSSVTWPPEFEAQIANKAGEDLTMAGKKGSDGGDEVQ